MLPWAIITPALLKVLNWDTTVLKFYWEKTVDTLSSWLKVNGLFWLQLRRTVFARIQFNYSAFRSPKSAFAGVELPGISCHIKI